MNTHNFTCHSGAQHHNSIQNLKGHQILFYLGCRSTPGVYLSPFWLTTARALQYEGIKLFGKKKFPTYRPYFFHHET